jgi:hypothetical protein
MRGHQRRVHIDDHRMIATDVTVRGVRTSQLPRPGTCPRTGGGDRGQRLVRVPGQRVNQPRHRRIRGNQAEHRRLRPHGRDVGQAIAAQGHRDRQITDDLPRVVDRGRPTPPAQCRRQRTIKPDPAIVATSSVAPAFDTTPVPAVSTFNDGYNPVGFLTRKVLQNLYGYGPQ